MERYDAGRAWIYCRCTALCCDRQKGQELASGINRIGEDVHPQYIYTDAALPQKETSTYAEPPEHLDRAFSASCMAPTFGACALEQRRVAYRHRGDTIGPLSLPIEDGALADAEMVLDTPIPQALPSVDSPATLTLYHARQRSSCSLFHYAMNLLFSGVRINAH